MADKVIIVDVQSNLKEQTSQAKEFNKELDKAQSNKTATRTGSRAADTALSRSERGLTRGTSGTGGRGDERDFARQAQGLGGLVRVYATFAANIYAVTAAYSALSKAMDTANMVRAAESLSASYGVSLRNVSRELKSITDNALSASEALGFATLGGSAGLTTTQMSNLAKVAKGASLALGRDLTDSLQRVYRGTIKIEPELLDELGLMVKIDEAVKEYSRSLGKSALQLTDFERRQAFTNAVVTQGLQKFGEIAEQSTNPYTKLVGSVQDLSKEGLNLVNTVLAPLVDILSQSPTALVAVAGLIIGKLAKLAIPDLVTTVEDKLTTVSKVLAKSSASLQAANKEVIKSFESTAGFKFISSEPGKLVGQAAKTRKELNESLFKDLEAAGTGPIKLSLDTENLIKQYETALIKAQRNVQGTLSRPGVAPGTATGLQARNAALTSELGLVNSIKRGFETLADDERIAGEVRKQQNKDTLAVLRTQNTLTVLKLQEEGKYLRAVSQAYILEQAVTREKNRQVVATGLLGAAQKAVNVTTGAFTGALAAAKVGILGLVSRLPGIGAAVAIIASLGAVLVDELKPFGLLTGIADENNKKFETFSETIKTLGDSLEKLAKAQTLDQAFSLRTASLSLLIESRRELEAINAGFEKFQKSATGLDKFLDRAKGLVGFDTQADIAASASVEVLAKQAEVQGGLKSLGLRGELQGETYAQSLAQGRVVETVTLSDIELLKAWKESLPEENRLKKIAELQTKINNSSIVEAEAEVARRSDLAASQLELAKTSKDYTNSLIKQVPALKAQRELITGLGAALETSQGAATFLVGYTKEVATITGAELSKNLADLRAKLIAIDIKPIDPTLPEERQRAEALARSARRAALIEKEGSAYQQLTAQVFSVIESTNKLTQASADSERAIAGLNRQLRQISTVESVLGGRTGSTEAARQRAQDSIAKAQQSGLVQQIKTLRLFEQAQVESVRTGLTQGLGRPLAGQDSLALLKELSALKDLTQEQKVLVANAFKELSNFTPALIQAQTDLAVSQASQPTRLERNLGQLSAREEQAKRTRDSELKNLNTEADALKLTATAFGEVSGDLSTIFAPGISARESNINIQTSRNALADIQAEQAKLFQAAFDSGEDLTSDLLARNIALETSRSAEAERLKALEAQVPIKKLINNFNLQELQYASKLRQVNTDLEIQRVTVEDINSTVEQKLSSQTAVVDLLAQELAVTTELSEANIKLLELAKEEKGITEEAKKLLDTKILEEQSKLTLNTLKSERAITQERKAQRSLLLRNSEDRANLDRTYFENLAAYTAEYARQKSTDVGSIGEKFGKSMVDGLDATIDKFAELAQSGELSFKSIADFARSTFSDVLRDIASDIMKNVFRQLITGVLAQTSGSSGGGGLLGTIFNTVGGAILGGLGGIGEKTGLESLPASVNKTFADGGIMTSYGPVQLQKYATGGIASSPQLALFGEGRQNEAYVPLPDNRSIPVTLSGGSSGVVMGDTNINISIDSSGNAETSVEENSEYGRLIGLAVKRAVNEEFIRQSRPGGMIYNK